MRLPWLFQTLIPAKYAAIVLPHPRPVSLPNYILIRNR